MSLYAIGDLHLGLGCGKTMDRFGKEWKDHPEKLKKNWNEKIAPEDTVVIDGDVSWGTTEYEVSKDLNFIIDELSGHKILVRGNHDRFWPVTKTEKLQTEWYPFLNFLQNNHYAYRHYAIVGTKGYCRDYEDVSDEQAEKLMKREALRLRRSFDSAVKDGYEKFIMFLHYPPTAKGETESIFTEMAEEYGAEKVIYGHLHGKDKYENSLLGIHGGIEYELVSSDFLNFSPLAILE